MQILGLNIELKGYIREDDCCLVCQEEAETNFHALFDFSKVWQVWAMCGLSKHILEALRASMLGCF